MANTKLCPGRNKRTPIQIFLFLLLFTGNNKIVASSTSAFTAISRKKPDATNNHTSVADTTTIPRTSVIAPVAGPIPVADPAPAPSTRRRTRSRGRADESNPPAATGKAPTEVDSEKPPRGRQTRLSLQRQQKSKTSTHNDDSAGNESTTNVPETATETMSTRRTRSQSRNRDSNPPDATRVSEPAVEADKPVVTRGRQTRLSLQRQRVSSSSEEQPVSLK